MTENTLKTISSAFIEAWDQCLRKLSKQLNPQVFKSYIENLVIEDFDESTNTAIIYTPSKFISKYVDQQFKYLITSNLNEILGYDVILRFIENPNIKKEQPPITVVKHPVQTNIPTNINSTSINATGDFSPNNRFQNEESAYSENRALNNNVQQAQNNNEQFSNTYSNSYNNYNSASLNNNQFNNSQFNNNQKPQTQYNNFSNNNNLFNNTISNPTRSALNPNYRFSHFVVGNNNQLCHAAAEQVATCPGEVYNPLFIYGESGLGKTHLLHAIGNEVLANHPNYNVVYLPAESFLSDLVYCLANNKNGAAMANFKTRMRNIDVLLIDDIQIIADKDRIQEEFFHTFNALYNARHQIVMTSDKMPQDVPGIEERLLTRFSWGLITDVQAPDFETRAAILKRKAESENIGLDDNVIYWIAEHFFSNVRELEGALTKLRAISSLQHVPISIELAENAFQHLCKPKKINITVEDIKGAVANHFNLKISDIISKRRTRNLSFPRHIAIYLCRKHTTASYPEIGARFGGRDHSSIIHAANVVSNKLETDQELVNTIKEIEKRLLN